MGVVPEAPNEATNSAAAGTRRGLRTYCQFSILSEGERSTSLTHRSVQQSSYAPDAGLAPNWSAAANAAESKKATDLRTLDLREITSFTDYFIICTVSNTRQGHAVCDEIEKHLKERGEVPFSIEGYEPAEWILMDYGDFVVHIFSETARSYYDLERLWRHAKAIDAASAVAVS